jgi:cytochrome c-type biogenesis protein
MASSGLSPVLAFGAGALTILSPCVLPLVPIVLSSAAQRHRFGPLALAIGLVLSFTLVGFLAATLGASSGFDSENARIVGAVMLTIAGIFLISKAAQALVTRLATPLANWGHARQAGLERFGLVGQGGIGALLGVVWSPCVGPTLGAATVLAAQGEHLGEVMLVLFAFGGGIATVLLVLATITRTALSRWRSRMMATGKMGKTVLGSLLMIVGVLIFTGYDRVIEGVLVMASPDWLTDLTTMI